MDCLLVFSSGSSFVSFGNPRVVFGGVQHYGRREFDALQRDFARNVERQVLGGCVAWAAEQQLLGQQLKGHVLEGLPQHARGSVLRAGVQCRGIASEAGARTLMRCHTMMSRPSKMPRCSVSHSPFLMNSRDPPPRTGSCTRVMGLALAMVHCASRMQFLDLK